MHCWKGLELALPTMYNSLAAELIQLTSRLSNSGMRVKIRARPVHEKRQSVCSRFRLMMNSVCNVRPAALHVQKAKTLTVLTLYRASASDCNRLTYRGLSKDHISSSHLPHVRKNGNYHYSSSYIVCHPDLAHSMNPAVFVDQARPCP